MRTSFLAYRITFRRQATPGDAGRLEFLVYASSSFRLAPSLLLGTINAEATGQTRSFPPLSSSLPSLLLYPAPYREKYVAR